MGVHQQVKEAGLVQKRQEGYGGCDLSDDSLNFLCDLLLRLGGLYLTAHRINHKLLYQKRSSYVISQFSDVADVLSQLNTQRSRVSFDSTPFTTNTSFLTRSFISHSVKQ